MVRTVLAAVAVVVVAWILEGAAVIAGVAVGLPALAAVALGVVAMVGTAWAGTRLVGVLGRRGTTIVALSLATLAASALYLTPRPLPPQIAEGLRLRDRAREAVEDKAVLHVRLFQPVVDDRNDDVVGDEIAARHDVFCLEADRRFRLHRRTQHVARGKARNSVPLDQAVALRALPGTRRTEEDESHRRAPRSFDFLIRPSY